MTHFAAALTALPNRHGRFLWAPKKVASFLSSLAFIEL